MVGAYGYRWVNHFGDSPEHDEQLAIGDEARLTDAGKMWAEGLAGMSSAQLGAGIRRAVFSAQRDPPTLPEFRAMCLGIPSLARVQITLARRNDDEDPQLRAFVRLVWSYIDPYRYNNDADPKSDVFIIRDAYLLAREHVMSGGELPPAPAGLLAAPPKKAPKPIPASDEFVAAELDKIRDALKLAGTGSHDDGQ